MQLNDSFGIGDRFAEEVIAGGTSKHQRRRDKLNDQVQEFLAQGGEIQEVPVGATGLPTQVKHLGGSRYVNDPES